MVFPQFDWFACLLFLFSFFVCTEVGDDQVHKLRIFSSNISSAGKLGCIRRKTIKYFQPAATLEKPRADVEAPWKKPECFFREEANQDQTVEAEAMSGLREVCRFVGQSLEDLGLFVVSLANSLLDLLWSHSAQILGLTSFLSKSRIFRSVSPFEMLRNLLKNSGLLLSWLKTLLLKLTNIFLSKVQWFLYFKISSSVSQQFLFILPLVLFVIINRYFDHSM